MSEQGKSRRPGQPGKSGRPGQSGRPERRNEQRGQDQGQGQDRNERRNERRNEQGRTRNRGTSGGPRQYSASAPSQRRRSADPSRLAAFETLTAVSRDDAYANLVLPGRIAAHRLDKRDAGFATELTYGALRGQGFYDAVLATCVDRPLDQLDRPVLDALRLGAHQLLGMRVPSHAALDSTVSLVRDQIGAGLSGLVNAVLRKVTAQDREAWLDQLAPVDEQTGAASDAALAIRHSHPQWIIRALRQSLANHGRPAEGRTAELEALLEADNAAPVVNLVALPGLGDLQPVLAAGAEPGPLAPGSALYRDGDAGRLPGVKEGTIRVQDVGSQLTARALAAVPVGRAAPGAQGASGDSHATERWLDLCAGPGGKAALMGGLARVDGARVDAVEVSAHRAKLVEKAVRDLPVTVHVADGRDPGLEPGYDRVLVDAPCSGLGALRRRPEARWRKTESDIAELNPLQFELLTSALRLVRPGGVVVYATCSPDLRETRAIVDKAIAELGAEELDAHALVPGMEDTGDHLSVQMWPHRHGTDAMFLAVLRRGLES